MITLCNIYVAKLQNFWGVFDKKKNWKIIENTTESMRGWKKR